MHLEVGGLLFAHKMVGEEDTIVDEGVEGMWVGRRAKGFDSISGPILSEAAGINAENGREECRAWRENLGRWRTIFDF